MQYVFLSFHSITSYTLNQFRTIIPSYVPIRPELTAVVAIAPTSIPDVLAAMQAIDDLCVAGDGLKWFNWLYLQVMQAVETQVSGGGFVDSRWLSELDIQFAKLYFNALHASLTNQACPWCWASVFAVRARSRIARIQFALAGMNAHINHDLPMAIMGTCKSTETIPQHGTPQCDDYTGLNASMDALIQTAKQTLNVRLFGDLLPAVSSLENSIAAWDLATAREKAWNTAQRLWKDSPDFLAIHMDVIDGLTTVKSKILPVPVP